MSTRLSHLGAAILLLVACAPATLAGELLRLDGPPIEAELISAKGGRLEFHNDSETFTLSGDDLVRWGAPATRPLRPRVVLRDGSELVAGPPWTKEGSVVIADGAINIQTAVLRQITLPIEKVDWLQLQAARDRTVAVALPAAADLEPSKADELFLVSGDVLKGKLSALAGGKLSFTVGGKTVEIEASTVAAVRLAAGEKSEPIAGDALLLGLKDGSILRASRLAASPKSLQVSLAGGGEVRGRKAADVVFLQNLSGGATYLSDLTPLDFRHAPYAGIVWGYGRDENLAGEELRVAGKRYLKGLAMHSPSRIVYRLSPGEHRRLEFAMAIDDSAETNDTLRGGSVIYRVLVARAGGFELAYTSPVVRSGDPPRHASLDISEARAMVLVVEPADFGDRLDHADWLDARLVR